MAGTQGYAVVSCHVERVLDDGVWQRYFDFISRRPAGFTIASLMRPPADGEDKRDVFLTRAQAAAAAGPLGHHTHWTSPTHARPTGGDPAAQVLREGAWLRDQGLAPTVFCGGGWYSDADVIRAVAELGYADCTATAWRPQYLPEGAPRLALDQPAWVLLPDGRRVLELPTTHSTGALVRSIAHALPPVVHVHFHDYELLDRRRTVALTLGLRALRLRRRPARLDEVHVQREEKLEVLWGG